MLLSFRRYGTESSAVSFQRCTSPSPHTITSMKKMAAEIKEIRAQGSAVDREEAAEDRRRIDEDEKRRDRA
jgi:DNA-binding IclR family transcriptional regulator